MGGKKGDAKNRGITDKGTFPRFYSHVSLTKLRSYVVPVLAEVTYSAFVNISLLLISDYL